jgi:hypothetical protein
MHKADPRALLRDIYAHLVLMFLFSPKHTRLGWEAQLRLPKGKKRVPILLSTQVCSYEMPYLELITNVQACQIAQ